MSSRSRSESARAAAACIAATRWSGTGSWRCQTVRTISRRASLLSSVISDSSSLDQGDPQLGETAAAGGADAADGHPELGRELAVVGSVLERHDAQQAPAPLGQAVDRGPQPVALVVLHDGVLHRVLARQRPLEIVVLQRGGGGGAGGAPRLPTGRGGQPAADRD